MNGYGNRRSKIRFRGFTILELLVSITLTMVIGTAVLALYANYLRLYKRTRTELEFLAALRNVTGDMERQINAMVYKAGYYKSLTPFYPVSVPPDPPPPDPLWWHEEPAGSGAGWKYIHEGLFQCHFKSDYLGFYVAEQENLVHRAEYYYNPGEGKHLVNNDKDDDGDAFYDTNNSGIIDEGDDWVNDNGTFVVRKTLDAHLLYDDGDALFDSNPLNEGELDKDGDGNPDPGDADATNDDDDMDGTPSSAVDADDDDYVNDYLPPDYAGGEKEFGRALFKGVENIEFSYLYTDRNGLIHSSDHWPLIDAVTKLDDPEVATLNLFMAGSGKNISLFTPPLGINLRITLLLDGQTKVFSTPVVIYASRWNQLLNP